MSLSLTPTHVCNVNLSDGRGLQRVGVLFLNQFFLLSVFPPVNNSAVSVLGARSSLGINSYKWICRAGGKVREALP